MAFHYLSNIWPSSWEKRVRRHEGAVKIKQSPNFDLTDFA
jgi:hypothetical protein